MKNKEQERCAVCGRVIKSSIIRQKVGEFYYVFDKDDCVMILKKFHSVYGNDYCMMFKE